MTSEQNLFSFDKYSHFQKNQNPDPFPNRKPTEGEIDQFIELLKNSNNEISVENNQSITEQCSSTQHGDCDLKSDVPLAKRKQNSFSNVENCESSSRVTFNNDGTLLKTIHVQSSESYIREAERFERDRSKHDLGFGDNSFRSSGNRTSSPTTSDYLRKTTFLNKNSELKVTISRDQDKSLFNQGNLKEEMSSRDESDSRILNEETMHPNKTFGDIYSRNYGYSLTRECPDSIAGSSSYGRLSGTTVQEKRDLDFDLDMSIPSNRSPPMNSQRRSHSGDRRILCERSPPPSYQENYKQRLRDDSPYRTNYHHGNAHERSPGFPSMTQWKNSPTVTESSREKGIISGDIDIYNSQEEESFSDFEVGRNSPEFNDGKLYGKRKPSPLRVPSPPPPPVLSDVKKKKAKSKSGCDNVKVKKVKQKSPVNPISTLLADRNVSISSLLEAAIGTDGSKTSSQYVDWDPATKMKIVSNCEEKIGQLYRHRVSGPGSFIPDGVTTCSSSYGYKSPLVSHHPRLEFNSRPVPSIWNYPGIFVPETKTSTKASRLKSTMKRKEDDDDDDDDVILLTESSADQSGPRIETKVSYNDRRSHRTKNVQTFGSGVEGEPISSSETGEQFMNQEQWHHRYNTEQYNSGESMYSSLAPNFPSTGFSETQQTFESNHWPGLGYQNVGFSQQKFENQQLVQYPVGYQPIGPRNHYVNNQNYPAKEHSNMPTFQGDNSQFNLGTTPTSNEMGHYRSAPEIPRFMRSHSHSVPPADGHWYPVADRNIPFPDTNVETVQYPLKQRYQSFGNDNSSFVNTNLISLTGKKSEDTKKPVNIIVGRREDDENKNKSKKKYLEIEESAQYPLKQRSNNPYTNLISLTGIQKSKDEKATTPSTSNKQEQTNPSSSENKDKLRKKSRCTKSQDVEKQTNPSSDENIDNLTRNSIECQDYPPLDLDKTMIAKLLEVSTQIRNIQLCGDKSGDIIKDLETGPKIYSYAYSVDYQMLLKKDQKHYKIYISETGENAILNLLHTTFHEISEIELEVVAKKILTYIPRIQEKINNTYYFCTLCRRVPRMETKVYDRSSGRYRSRSPLRKRHSYKSPPPKRSREESRRSVSKERRNSRERDHRGRFLGPSRYRRSISIERVRTGSRTSGRSSGTSSSLRSPYREKQINKRYQSPEIEVIEFIVKSETSVDTIDLTDELVTTEIEESEVLREKPNEKKVPSFIKNENTDYINEAYNNVKSEFFIVKRKVKDNNMSAGAEGILEICEHPEIKEESNSSGEFQENNIGKNENLEKVKSFFKVKEEPVEIKEPESIIIKQEAQPNKSTNDVQTFEKNVKPIEKTWEPFPKLDFKTRIRNIQLENNELKSIIESIERSECENIDKTFSVKGGILCRKCAIGCNNEVRIVFKEEQLVDIINVVHTMSATHAALDKTIMLFKKHFQPTSHVDKIIQSVVNNCQFCKN